MPNHRLDPGARFRQQGRDYCIEEALPDGRLGVRDLATGSPGSVTNEEFVAAVFDGSLEVLGPACEAEALERHTDLTRVPDLSALTQDDPRRVEAIRRFHYVAHVSNGPTRTRSKRVLTPAIRTVAEHIGDRNPPSWRTLARWLRAWQRAGGDIRALVPATKARGNRRPKASGRSRTHFSDEDYERARVVEAFVAEAIRTHYLTTNRLTVRSTHEALQARIADENRRRPAHDQLPVPHISSLYRDVASLDAYEVTAARHGRRVADQAFRVTRLGPRPSRVLERVEGDHTRLDLMVVDPLTRLPLGRPWLTTLVDCHSRMVLGMYLGFYAPSYLSVMQCLRHAIRPKGYLGEVYPSVEHDWPAWGVPELLVVDNAKEFYSRHFEDACLQLSIQVDYAPPRCGAYKGTIERWFGTQNTRLLHELPGTTFSDIFDRGDYDPAKHAVISLDALLELIHVWIVDVYHQQVQRGLGDIPHRRWSAAVAEHPPGLPRSASDLDVLVGCVAERRITNSGIELFTLRYNSPELGLIRRSVPRGEKVRLKYDPADLSAIYVLDPARDSYVAVPALDEQYTRRLTLWQHDVIRRYARRTIAEQVDTAGLVRARERIEQIVARERVLQRRLGGRQSVARFLDLGQPDYATARASTVAGVTNDSEMTADRALVRAPSADPIGTPAGCDDESGWSANYDLPRRGEEQR